MRHYVRNTSRQAYRRFPYILCETHWLAFAYGTDMGGIYSECVIPCGTSARDCDRCEISDQEASF